MPETVGQHGVATFTSPVNGTTPIDANTVRGNDNTIRTAYVDHDSDPGIHVQSSALASRPVAGTAGRKWMTVDGTVTRFWIDTGSTWLEVQASAFSTARTLWGQSFDGTANVSGNLSSVGDIAMTGALSGATSLSATNLTGTLQTAAQPNVTSVGTLSSLTVSGNVTVDTNTLFVDATNNRVGIGTTSPIGSVDSISNATAAFVARASTTGANQTTDVLTVYNADASLFALARYNATQHIWRYAGTTEGMRLDMNGNLGLGVTPSAWTANARALQVGNVGALFRADSGGVNVSQNVYESAANTYLYGVSFFATRYEQQSGQHRWFTAPSGTAGNAISFTQAMTLDASGNLGVGTTSPGARLDVNGDANVRTGFAVVVDTIRNYTGGGVPLNIGTGGAQNITFSPNGTERMRLDTSGNLGVGVTPSAWASSRAIDIGSYSSLSQRVGGTSELSLSWNLYIDSGTSLNTGYRYKATGDIASAYTQNGAHIWYTAPTGTAGAAVTLTQVMRLDPAGNLGLGVTPSAWSSTYRFIDIGSGGSAAFGTVGGTADTTNNAYHNGTSWLYKATAAATLYRQQSGIHYWFTAPSGTAGNAITFTQAMTLDASGNLLLGLTSPNNAIFDAYSAANGIARIRGGSGTNQGGAFFVSNSAGTQTLAAFGDTARMLGGTPDASVTMFAGNVPLAFYVNAAERARIKAEGQFRFVPLSAAPTTNVENGDVYYDSTTNKLRVRAAGAWVDLH